MNGRRLNKVITIQGRVGLPDSEGNVVDTFVTLANIRASVEPIIGREYFAAGAEQSEVTYKVRIRYRKGITSVVRVLYGSKILEVLSAIDPFELHREWLLMCKEVVPVGG